MMQKQLTIPLAISACVIGYFVMTVWGDEQKVDALRDEAAAILRQAEEHAASGRVEEARELTQRAQRLRAEAEEIALHHEREARQRQERQRHERHAGQEHNRQTDGGHEQIAHLRQAAEHLHAAGMHEPAEQFLREAERREHERMREQAARHDEGLRRHVEELTQHVRELNERVERMERVIRELSERRDD